MIYVKNAKVDNKMACEILIIIFIYHINISNKLMITD